MSSLKLEPTEYLNIQDVQSGDLLAWGGSRHSALSNLMINSIRMLTRADFGHVGIAWRVNDGVSDDILVIEACIPRIRAQRVFLDDKVVAVPMNVSWSEKAKTFLTEKIGLPYSPMDAIRAYFGKTLADDDSWQCAELCHWFYQEVGINLFHDFTPGGLVGAASTYAGNRVCHVTHSGEST